ncbi:MAG: YggT family protein [Polyangiaceae bacterium]
MPWPISWLLSTGFWIIELCVVAHAVTYWLRLDSKHPLVRLIRAPAEPLIRLARPLARKIPGPLDWSHAIVLLVLELLKRVLT